MNKAVIYARVSSVGDRQSTDRQIEDLTAAGVNVFILDLNLSTLDEEGRENPVAKMVLTVLALGAEMERKLILGRLNSGRELAKRKGVRMGRPKGSSLSDEALAAKYPEVLRHLRKGKNSIREIAKLTGVSVSTIQRVKKSLT